MIERTVKILNYFVQFVYYKNIRKSDDYLEVIKKSVLELGGLYIKLIQFLCLRTAIFPDEYKISFLSFYDAVPFEPLDIQRILTKELDAQKLSQIEWLSEQPFASGTFGQVYRGQLTNGIPIIIKLKRPGLLPKLKTDFMIVKLFTYVFDLLYYQKIIDVKRLVQEFEKFTYKELDYVMEAKNAEYFYRIYKGHPHLYIPKTFINLCTKNILTQEYVAGISMTDIIRYKYEESHQAYRSWLKEKYNTDIFFILENVAFELGMQAFKTSKFYADPHPGNIKIMPNNRYALIDFGIIGKSPVNRKNYYQIISLLSQPAQERDLKRLSEEFLEWGADKFYRYIEVLDEHFYQKNTGLTQMLIKKYSDLLNARREQFSNFEQLDRENFTKLYLEIVKTGQYLNVKIPEGMLATMRTVAIYKSWAHFLEPEFHRMRQTYLKIIASLDYRELSNGDKESDRVITLEEAIEHVLDWAATLAEEDMSLYNQIQKILKEPLHV